jgi:hypothetical protein
LAVIPYGRLKWQRFCATRMVSELRGYIGHAALEKKGRSFISGTETEALERLRKNHYHLWKVLKEAEADPSLPERWRQAPRGSQEWRKAIFFEQAIWVLEVALSD